MYILKASTSTSSRATRAAILRALCNRTLQPACSLTLAFVKARNVPTCIQYSIAGHLNLCYPLRCCPNDTRCAVECILVDKYPLRAHSVMSDLPVTKPSSLKASLGIPSLLIKAALKEGF